MSNFGMPVISFVYNNLQSQQEGLTGATGNSGSVPEFLSLASASAGADQTGDGYNPFASLAPTSNPAPIVANGIPAGNAQFDPGTLEVLFTMQEIPATPTTQDYGSGSNFAGRPEQASIQGSDAGHHRWQQSFQRINATTQGGGTLGGLGSANAASQGIAQGWLGSRNPTNETAGNGTTPVSAANNGAQSDGNGTGAAESLLNLLGSAANGATAQSATAANGSTSTTITFPDGSTVTLTVPPPGGSSSSSSVAATSTSSGSSSTASSSTGTGASTTSSSAGGSDSNSQFSPLEALIAAQANALSSQALLTQITDGSLTGTGSTSSQTQQNNPYSFVGNSGNASVENFLSMLTSGDTGATSSVTTNANGSSTTTITYANGSSLTLTTAAPSTTSSSTQTADSSGQSLASNNLIEQMIELQAALLGQTSTQSTTA